MPLENNHEKKVTPFLFQGLSKISRKDLEIENALLNYLPSSSSGTLLQEKLEEFFTDQFGLKSKIRLEKFEEQILADFLKQVPEFCVLTVLGAEPLSSKVFVWIDSMLAFSLIDRTLGGVGELPTELRGLTSIEEGVFQYLLLKTMYQIYQLWEESAAIQFRVESILKSRKELAPYLNNETKVVLLHYRIQVGPCVGFFVMAVPHPFIEKGMLHRAPLESPERTQDYKSAQKIFEQMGHIRTPLWVEIGKVSLTMAEKNQLEKGDVILFDETHAQFVQGELTGNVIARVGEGKGGGLFAQLVSSASPAIIKILDFYGGD